MSYWSAFLQFLVRELIKSVNIYYLNIKKMIYIFLIPIQYRYIYAKYLYYVKKVDLMIQNQTYKLNIHSNHL